MEEEEKEVEEEEEAEKNEEVHLVGEEGQVEGRMPDISGTPRVSTLTPCQHSVS